MHDVRRGLFHIYVVVLCNVSCGNVLNRWKRNMRSLPWWKLRNDDRPEQQRKLHPMPRWDVHDVFWHAARTKLHQLRRGNVFELGIYFVHSMRNRLLR